MVPQDVPVGVRTRHVGVVAPYDLALDRELWRWTPPSVDLHLTRTPFLDQGVTMEMVNRVGDEDVLRQCRQDLSSVRPDVYAYACTSGSFVRGLDGERRIAATLATEDHPGVTPSGALVAALAALGVEAVAVGTPYTEDITARLRDFLEEAGHRVTGVAALGLSGHIPEVPDDTTRDLARRALAAGPGAQALFLSCTNLPTYDVIAPLEQELGVPVLSANQVTLWRVLDLLGMVDDLPTDQRLFTQATRKASR